MEKEFDFVIFGGSSSKGKYVCDELFKVLKLKGYELRWAVAGRNRNKLDDLLKWLSSRNSVPENELSRIGLLHADTEERNTLVDMCKRAKVVLDCVGPYKLYGEQVIHACIVGNSDYVDLSGVQKNLLKLNEKYSSKAEYKHLYIISAFGFEAIPREFGLMVATQQFNGSLNNIESYLEFKTRKCRLKLDYNVYSSLVHALAPDDMQKEFGEQMDSEQTEKLRHKPKGICFNSDIKQYVSDVPNCSLHGDLNSETAETETLLSAHQNGYSLHIASNSLLNALSFRLFMWNIKTFARVYCGRRLLLNHPKFFSCGVFSFDEPREEELQENSFCMNMIGTGPCLHSDDTYPEGRLTRVNSQRSTRIRIKISGPELAYVTSSIANVQVALTLLLERAKLPTKGGMFTPSMLFQKTSIIARLHERGVKFQVIPNDEEQ